MVRAERLVGTLSTTVNLLGESSWTTVSVPSPLDANAKFVAGIEPVGIDAFSDRRGCNYLSCVRIDDSHHLVVAAGKETAILPVHS